MTKIIEHEGMVYLKITEDTTVDNVMKHILNANHFDTQQVLDIKKRIEYSLKCIKQQEEIYNKYHIIPTPL